MKKYELTTNTKVVFGRKLFRIKALIAFGDVEVGELGGFIEKEENLDQDGDAWVYGNACVCDNARVYDDAWVCGNACICDDARVYGNAQVYGNACVCDDARVYGNARVCGDAWTCGSAWVCGNARVYGDARVYGNAQVCGNACVCGDADHLLIGPIGSRKGYATFYRRKDGETMVVCGCFHDNINAFAKRVQSVHGDNVHGKCYAAAVDLARLVMNTNAVEDAEVEG